MDILELQSIPKERKELIAIISDARRESRKRRMMRYASIACMLIGMGVLVYFFAPHTTAQTTNYHYSYLAEVRR